MSIVPVFRVGAFRQIAAFFLWVACVSAQSERGVLFGVVRDSTGALMASADIVLVNRSTGLSREMKSDGRGLYYFTQLPPGQYEMTLEAKGFKKYRNTSIR